MIPYLIPLLLANVIDPWLLEKVRITPSSSSTVKPVVFEVFSMVTVFAPELVPNRLPLGVNVSFIASGWSSTFSAVNV